MILDIVRHYNSIIPKYDSMIECVIFLYKHFFKVFKVTLEVEKIIKF